MTCIAYGNGNIRYLNTLIIIPRIEIKEYRRDERRIIEEHS